MIRSLRFRLTGLYLAFFSLLFILFSIFLYGVLSGALQARLDETLSAEANTLAGLLLDELEEMKGDVPAAAHEAVANLRLHGGLVAIFAGGNALASTTPVQPHEFDRVLSYASTNTSAEFVVTLTQMGKYGGHVAVHRLAASGRSFLLLAAESLDSVAAELALVRRVIFISLPLMLALAGLGGYVLSTRSLAPLASMASQASKITGSNLETRLDIGNPAEELAVLVASFNELLSRLDQSFESMRRFVADASHELRTPIAIIRGEADVALSQDRGAAEYQESLAIILDESRRLSHLVDDLLNLARADAGHVKLQTHDFYLNDLLADCCRSVQALAAARQIAVECCGPGDIQFRGDEELLRRLVMNLLDNAIRYTPPGGRVEAVLETFSNVNQGSQIRISISDTGMGIGPEAVPHIFERFFRADKARSRQDGGFGLGLAIVKWIAESHNGVVDLNTKPGVGSAFTVTLPR
jgi:two-component system OmpR family sensor kinase